jgi:hypothetical protein
MTNNDVHHYTVPNHLVADMVGSEVIVFDTTTDTTHRLTARAADVFLALKRGAPPPHNANDTIQDLATAGLLVPTGGIARRAVVTGIAAGGLVSLTMPHVAAATSTHQDLPVTTFGFDTSTSDWGWELSGTNLDIYKLGDGLKETDRFIPGEVWTMTLVNADGRTSTAPVVSSAGPSLTLSFRFPDTQPGSFPVSLTAQLSRNTGTEILQTPEFTITAFP